MTRLSLLLVLLLLASALGAVSAQHQSRRLFLELEREQARMRALEEEWGQLQLEQSTWAAHARVEKFAREKLRMRTPAPAQMIAAGAER